jgi:hypothetical protein
MIAQFADSSWGVTAQDYDDFLDLVSMASPTERDFLLARAVPLIHASGHSLAHAVLEVEKRRTRAA